MYDSLIVYLIRMAWYSHSEDARLIPLILRFDGRKERKMERKEEWKKKRKIETISVEEDYPLPWHQCLRVLDAIMDGMISLLIVVERKKLKVVGAMLYILMVRHQWNGVCYIDCYMYERNRYCDKGQLYWISKTEPFEF